ncbi:LytR/AlgR family response regulator transcription factor [Flavobacterium sp. AG291]|uniref:LytR/AlgR family response regulator transcription factor n=1 Tax=Flavobacterium sp. AG291 TaxID=2184000 RepID=UPI000E0A6FFF|nr:LytTR family transcriptional regulator DNA-binding domain-containing protein [Flavobacterium sp. AG291]RDI11218.1 LytTr DNA-binding domain-containing protein [Flavobacterium sp. AG291]
MTDLNVIALYLQYPEVNYFKDYFGKSDLGASFVSLDSVGEIKSYIKAGYNNVVIVDFDFKYTRIFDFIEISLLKDVVFVVLANPEGFSNYSFKKIHILHRPFSGKKISILLGCIIEYFKEERFNSDRSELRDKNVLCIPSLDRIDLVKIDDILYCAADGKYTTFHLLSGQKLISSKNIGLYEKKLGSDFLRVHHSYLVNGKHITSLTKKKGFFCELSNSVVIPVSKRKQGCFNKYFDINSLK